MTIQNHGGTTGFITKVEWGFCSKAEFPQGVFVSQIIDKNMLPWKVQLVPHPHDVIAPTGMTRFPYRHVEFYRSKHVGEIFFGRIHYRDVFKETHYSTFALLLGPKYSDSIGGSYSEDWN